MKQIRIRTKQDLEDAVESFGILPFFSSSIPGFSVEEMCDPSVYFTDQPGVWEWKGPVIQETGCAYGKFFGKKAAFIARKWFPDYCSWRRDGYDFDARAEDGLADYRLQYLYGLIEKHRSVLSKDLKIEGGYAGADGRKKDGWEPRKGFDTDIAKLQMLGYVTTTDFEYELDRNGKEYGWGLARYAVVENHFPASFRKQLYQRTPRESYRRLLRHLEKVLPDAPENEIEYFLNLK